MRKRALSLFLVLAMLFSIVPAYAVEGETKGEILAFDLEETAYTASLGTIEADLGLPDTIPATVNEPVTTVTGNDKGTPTVTTAMETVELDVPVTWTCNGEHLLAMEGDYTFTARAEGYTLADGVEWPTVTVTLEHRLADGIAVINEESAGNMAYVSSGATGGMLNDRTQPYGDLLGAVSALNQAGGGTIYVMNDVQVTRKNTVVTSNITIATDPQAGGVSTVWSSGTATLFSMQDATLTIENLILDGGNQGGNAFIIVGEAISNAAGDLVLGNGAVIRNVSSSFGAVWTSTNEKNSVTIKEGAVISANTNKGDGGANYHSGYGGAVTLRGGTLTMEGGKITGNTANYGGGVAVLNNANFQMTGGQIGGNTAQSGGGVYQAGGAIRMTAGEITGNVSEGGMWVGGGGVRVAGGTAGLGGTISNNRAHDGGGVLVYSSDAAGAEAEISGYVTGNTATYGAGVYVGKGSATLNGATILGNSSYDYGGGAFLHNGNNGTMTLSGRLTILDNISHANSAPEENNLLIFTPGEDRYYVTLEDLDARSDIGVTVVNTNTWNRQIGWFAMVGKAEGVDDRPVLAEKVRELLEARIFHSDDPEYSVVDGTLNQVWYALSLARRQEVGYYVSSNGSDDKGDGSRERPFATLGYATTVAQNSGSEVKTTVYVMDDITEKLNGVVQLQGSEITIATDPETLEESGPATVSLTGSGYFAQFGPSGGREQGVTTLRDIVFDGANRDAASGSSAVYGPFYVPMGKLVLDEGAVIRNFKSNTPAVFTSASEMPAPFHQEIGIEIRDGAAIQKNAMVKSSNSELTNVYAAGGGGAVGLLAGTLTMTGGEISGNTAPYGGGVYMSGGTVTMSEDAVISGNNASATAFGGGGIHIAGGEATLGGTITGNFSQDGGAVYLGGADAKVTITGNITRNSSKIAVVYLHEGTAVLNGAVVKDNTSSHVSISGVYLRHDDENQNLDVTLSGDTVITGNTGLNGVSANLSVYDNMTVNLDGLTAAAEIGVNIFKGSMGSFATGTAEEANASQQYFHADNTALTVLNDGVGTLSLGYAKNNYYVSSAGNDGTDDGTPENPYATLARAYRQAMTDGALTDEYGAVIHIMDAVTMDSYQIIDSKGTLTLTGTGPDGTLYKNAALVAAANNQYSSSNVFGMLRVSNITLNIDHLTLQGHKDSSTESRAIRLYSGTVNLNEGTVITGWHATNATSALYAVYASDSAQLSLSGDASISGNTGGGVYMHEANTLTLSGAPVISGNTYEGETSNVRLNRKSAAGDGPIAITGVLESGAAIGVSDGVTASGTVFAHSTEENAGANLGFFFADDGQSAMSARGAELVWNSDPVARIDGKTYTTLADAVAAVEDGQIIEILRDITLTQGIAVSGKRFTLTSASDAEGQSFTIGRAANFKNEGCFFTLSGSAGVTVENLTLDGGKQLNGNVARIFDVNGASLTLKSGAILQNVRGENYYGKGAIYARNSAKIVMYDGAVIRDCEAGYGAAVTLYHSANSGSIFTMYGGTITGNHSYGRAFSSNEDPTFGAVHVGTECTFDMRGGAIIGNTGDGKAMPEQYQDAGHGAGVNLYGSNAEVILSGNATVTGNTFTTSDGTEIPDNIYIGWSDKETKGTPAGTVSISGAYAGRAGLSLYETIRDEDGVFGNANGYVFGSAADTPSGAENIVSDVTPGLMGAVSGGNLMWSTGDLYVASTGSDETGYGTEQSPYATLDHAVSQAADGAAIHIMDAVTVTDWVNIGKNLTITGTDSRGMPYANAALVAGGTFYQGGSNNTYGMFGFPSATTLTIDNLTLDGAGYNTRAARVWRGASLNLHNVTATGWKMGAFYVNNEISLSGQTTITGNGGGIGFGANTGVLTVSGTVVIENNTDAAGNNANVTLWANRTPATDIQIAVDGRLGGGSRIGVTDGAAAEGVIFAANGSADLAKVNLDKFFADNGQDITASDGMHLVWGGYVARVIRADGTFERYDTLQAAVNAAKTGETVELLTDTTETTVIITTDFAALDWAGHTLTGRLNVADGGNVGVIRNTVNGEQNFVTGGVNNIGGSGGIAVQIQAGGAVGEIAGGRYVENGYEAISVNGGTLGVISGGWFTGYKLAVCLYGGSLTVTGGVFDYGQHPVQNGTIGAYNWPADLIISGGYFENREDFDYIGAKLNVIGRLSEEAVQVVGQGGITTEDNNDAYYPVAQNYVARVNNGTNGAWTYYTTLKAAVEDLGTGNTVELLKDIDLNETITMDKTFILRSNRDVAQTYTLTRAENFTGNMFTVIASGRVTVEKLVLDGGANWVGPVDSALGRGTTNNGVDAGTGYILYVDGGDIVLGAGAVVRNNERNADGDTGDSTGADHGGAISVQDGTLTMEDGSAIRDSATNGPVADGGAVTVWKGSFTMTGGEITGCYGSRWGAVRIGGVNTGIAAFTMSGGSITHNRGDGAAGVYGWQDGGGAVSVVRDKAVVSVSGDAVIKDNYYSFKSSSNKYELREQNLALVGNVLLNLTDDFTGSMGVYQTGTSGPESGDNVSGGQFGLNTAGHAGASNFFNDVDGDLYAMTTADGKLVWAESMARTSNDGGRTWREFGSLQEAVNAVDSDPNTVSYVEPLDSLSLDTAITTDKTFTLRSYSAGAETMTLGRAEGFAGTFFDLAEGANVTVANLTLDGGETGDAQCALIRVNAKAAATLEDGATLQNNQNTAYGKDVHAGGVMVHGGTLYVRDGATIRNNSAYWGGGVHVNNGGTLNMTGGIISGNTSTANDNGSAGGGIGMYDGNGTVNISGNAQIVNNTAVTGGGVYGLGTVNISGNVTITGNTSTANNTPQTQNLYLTGNGILHLNGSFTGSVGVTDSWSNANNKAGEQFGISNDAGYSGAGSFFNDLDSTLMGSTKSTKDGDILVWADGGAVARTSNDGGQTWTEYATLQEAVNAADSDPNTVTYVELLRSIELDATVRVESGKSVELRSGTRDTDGTYTVKRAAGLSGTDADKGNLFWLSGNAEVTVTDLVVDGNGMDSASSRLFRVGNGASLTLNDGAILQNNYFNHNYNSGTVFLYGGGTLVMNEGSVIRDSKAGYGSAVTLFGNGGVKDYFIMNGGTITGNHAAGRSGTLGGAVYVQGDSVFTMNGGAITANTNSSASASKAGAGVELMGGFMELSGDAVITGNTIEGGTVSNLSVNSSNQITLTGNFTGSVGLFSTVESQNAAGQQFGLNTNGYSGAKNFANDVDSTLIGTADGGMLVWADNSYVARVNNLSDGGWTEYTSLADAVAAVANGGDIVELLRDIELDAAIRVDFNKPFILRSGTRAEDETYTITRGEAFTTGNLFTITNGKIIMADIVLDGNKDKIQQDTRALISISGSDSAVTLGDGAILQNNNGGPTYDGNSAGAVRIITGGSLTMEDGSAIRNCSVGDYAGAILVGNGTGAGAVFRMNGGSITGNTTESVRATGSAYGGTVYVWNGDVTMTGGVISGNAAISGQHLGGGVYVYSGSMTMSGGVITGNQAVNGGVALGSSATLALSGSAQITGNTNVSGGASNLYITSAANLSLAGNLAGQVGVTHATADENAQDKQFGVNTGGHTGAENFTNDVDASLVGTSEGATLKWAGGSAVARVNNGESNGWTEYQTLAEAVAAVQDGQIVELLQDVTESATITTDKDFTLRSSTKKTDTGKTFTIKRGAAVTLFSLTGDVTMENITLDGGAVYSEGEQWWASVSGIYGGAVMVTVSGGSLTLDGGAKLCNAARPLHQRRGPVRHQRHGHHKGGRGHRKEHGGHHRPGNPRQRYGRGHHRGRQNQRKCLLRQPGPCDADRLRQPDHDRRRDLQQLRPVGWRGNLHCRQWEPPGNQRRRYYRE